MKLKFLFDMEIVKMRHHRYIFYVTDVRIVLKLIVKNKVVRSGFDVKLDNSIIKFCKRGLEDPI